MQSILLTDFDCCANKLHKYITLHDVFMKLAVLYTGETRTIRKAITYVHHIYHENPHADFFAVLQCPEEERAEIRQLLETHLGNRLKSVEWFDKNNQGWLNLRTILLDRMAITPQWRNYLENSGSMIEYFQLYLAHNAILAYETAANIRYDFVMRTRPDVILNKPLCLQHLVNSENYPSIMEEARKCATDEQNVLYMFMNALVDPGRIAHAKHLHSNHSTEKYYRDCVDKIDDLATYVRHGKYLISLRNNVVYITNRENMDAIAKLGYEYGKYRMEGNDYWFNAESQLETICLNNQIALYNSTTDLENASLYEYCTANYFDETGALKSGEEFLFFICRHV